VHSGARALGIDVTPAGVRFEDDEPSDALDDRTMATIAYAVALEVTSEIANLAVGPDVRRVRERMLTWSEPI
jgi:hypothetical protein